MASEQDRQRRRQETRKRQQRLLQIQLTAVAAGMVVCAVLIWQFVSHASRTEPPVPSHTGPTTTAQTEAPASSQTVIHVAAAGDLTVTDNVVAAGATGMGYDYGPMLLDVMPALSTADLTIVNLEGNFCGAPYGTQTASAPAELANALAAAGVDLVQMANSYSIRSGLLGLTTTLGAIRAAGMEPVGAWENSAAFRSSGGYTIRNVGGLRIAVVAFTKGMDNRGLPAGSEDCVNVLYEDYATTYNKINRTKITQVLRNVAKEQPDFTIALLHWGSEFNEERSDSQDSIRRLMLAEGVDAIIGTHPHLVQEIEYDETAGTLVAWSLGDFIGDGAKAGSNYSVVLDLEITRDNVTGSTRLTGYSYTPIYITKPEETGAETLRPVRLEQAMAEYEAGSMNAVPQPLYDSMDYVRGRIASRTAGEG